MACCGWNCRQAGGRSRRRSAVEFKRRGEKQDFQFKVFPAGLQEGRATIRAVLESEGEKYSEGYTLVTREDLGSFYYYQPARQRVSIVDVKAPHDLKVGYIMGAGDDIPTVLQQVGMDVTLIPAEKIATEDLSKYGTIVLGIRAYDTQKDVATNNKKLLDFVSAGGTLVVQYNAGVGDFNAGKFTPYPAELSRARVSVEEAPVEILAPEDSVFHSPNTITARDFDGWVQERGLYFMVSGMSISRRCCRVRSGRRRRRRAGCCGRSTARGLTSMRDMRFSGSCRRACRGRCGCL